MRGKNEFSKSVIEIDSISLKLQTSRITVEKNPRNESCAKSRISEKNKTAKRQGGRDLWLRKVDLGSYQPNLIQFDLDQIDMTFLDQKCGGRKSRPN